MNPAIPFYRLPDAVDAIPELQRPADTSLRPRDIVACLRLRLWDEDSGRLVSTVPTAAWQRRDQSPGGLSGRGQDRIAHEVRRARNRAQLARTPDTMSDAVPGAAPAPRLHRWTDEATDVLARSLTRRSSRCRSRYRSAE